MKSNISTEIEKLAQIGDIRDALLAHVELMGDTNSLEGAIAMALNLAFKKIRPDLNCTIKIKTFERSLINL